MISLLEHTTVERRLEDCFSYVADFRNTAEWDVTAFQATKDTDGPVGLGTEFTVRCRLPIGSIDVRYTVTEFVAPSMITLQAESRLFEAVDTISLKTVGDQTQISYRADFSFKMPFSRFEGLLKPAMLRMGRATVASLGKALSDDIGKPTVSRGTATADKLLWPGLAMFSKWGYRRGRKRWNPLSASLKNRHIVVTGASSGLGLATARQLAERGASLTLVMRNPERAKVVTSELKQTSGNADIRFEIADLALMGDVDALASRLLRRKQKIDVLINNAGALFNERNETVEGLEQSFALLLLSPWRLTRALKPLLNASDDARVVNVVSGGMYSQKLRVDLLQAEAEGYNGAVAYARCKRALTVVTEEWARAWEDEGIVVNAMHPGWADTPGVETALPAFHKLTKFILRTPEEGADTIIWLAAATEASQVSGRLFLDREPRTTHLMSSTRETDEERLLLMQFLEDFDRDTAAAA